MSPPAGPYFSGPGRNHRLIIRVRSQFVGDGDGHGVGRRPECNTRRSRKPARSANFERACHQEYPRKDVAAQGVEHGPRASHRNHRPDALVGATGSPLTYHWLQHFRINPCLRQTFAPAGGPRSTGSWGTITRLTVNHDGPRADSGSAGRSSGKRLSNSSSGKGRAFGIWLFMASSPRRSAHIDKKGLLDRAITKACASARRISGSLPGGIARSAGAAWFCWITPRPSNRPPPRSRRRSTESWRPSCASSVRTPGIA